MKLNHIALHVQNLETSKQFYSNVLGLETVFEHPIKGKEFEKVTGIKGFDVTFAVLTDNTSSVNIELVEFKKGFDEKSSAFNHIAFAVKDVDELYEKLIKKGISTISEPVTLTYPHDKICGKRFFYFHDPDKNIIEVFNDREGLYSEKGS